MKLFNPDGSSYEEELYEIKKVNSIAKEP